MDPPGSKGVLDNVLQAAFVDPNGSQDADIHDATDPGGLSILFYSPLGLKINDQNIWKGA